MYFNKDGYIKYCKDYKAYWAWVENRNEDRYQTTIGKGKNYDSKNMMPTFRLLDMAVEILKNGKILVKRPNREELLAIRKGEWSYEELIRKAEEKMDRVELVYQESKLQEKPDHDRINQLLVNLRRSYYRVV